MDRKVPLVQEDLLTRVREAFDLGKEGVSMTAGARGALGQVWRLTAGQRVYAVKQVFAGRPPGPADVQAEIAFTRAAVAAGVRLPASHPDRQGGYLVPFPGGGWLRLYDWVDLLPADLAVSAEPLGVLLARLHACASDPVGRESSGAPPDQWYEVPPDLDGWPPLVTAAADMGASWAARLAAAVDRLPALHALLLPAEPTRMRTCHRDLHPANVLADDTGHLVVVDWDELGPADPARDLAATLLACFHDGEPDLASIQRAYRAYLSEGGPARLHQPADFTMAIAAQLNFLDKQVCVALDATAPPRDRDRAEREIDEGLRILPTPQLAAAILDSLDTV